MGVKWTREQVAGTNAGETLFGDQISKGEKSPAKTKRTREATNSLTKKVIDYLNDSGKFVAWRQNNIPSTRSETIIKADGSKEIKFHFKKGQVKVILLDIAAIYIPTGQHCELEVKFGSDKLSLGQIDRISAIKKANGISFAFKDFETFLFQIKPYLI